MALLLVWYKNIPYLDRFMKNGGGEAFRYTGGELYGKTVGVIGLGAIGATVSRLCAAFGMRVLGYSRTPKNLPFVEQVGLEELYRRSDVVTVHVPLTAETRHMAGAEAFSRMKPDALFVNTSRGAVVNEVELIQALRTHAIGGACLDVFEEEPLPLDNPLRALPNVLLTPHTAGFPDGVKFHRARYEFFLRNIHRVMAGQVPEHALNQPSVPR